MVSLKTKVDIVGFTGILFIVIIFLWLSTSFCLYVREPINLKSTNMYTDGFRMVKYPFTERERNFYHKLYDVYVDENNFYYFASEEKFEKNIRDTTEKNIEDITMYKKNLETAFIYEDFPVRKVLRNSAEIHILFFTVNSIVCTIIAIAWFNVYIFFREFIEEDEVIDRHRN